MQHADQHRARAGLTHEPRRRRFAPQRIVHQTGYRCAIRRAGEAMGEAPILERVRRRPPPRLDLGEDLDRGRQTSGRRHAGDPRGAPSFHRALDRRARRAPACRAADVLADVLGGSRNCAP